MFKKEKGITMIQMVITIIMMIIIASFSLYNARDTIIEAKVSKVYKEIMTVREGVVGAKVMETIDFADFGTKLDDFSSYPQLSSYYDSGDSEYYFLDFETKNAVISEALEIRNIENNYIVNVKDFENVEVFLVDGLVIGSDRIYSDDEILRKYNDIFAGR